MMKKISFLFLISIFITVFADVNVNIKVKRPLIINGKFAESETVLAEAGKPQISYLPLKILIPQNEEAISCEIISANGITEMQNVEIDYSRNFYPLSEEAFDISEKNEKIYGRDADFPVKDCQFLGIQFLCGYQIAICNIFPYKYNPVKKTLKWPNEIIVKVKTKINSELAEKQNKNLLTDRKTRQKIANLVINPILINSYSKRYFSVGKGLANSQNPHQMIIITDSEREPFFQEFIEWKNSHGIETAIFLKEDILAEPEYAGIDEQETIRNFIIDAYQTWSQTELPLEYVILGGDDEIIPVRGMWAAVDSVFAPGYEYHIVETFLPSDLYYGALDGNWNANGNEFYGEPDDEPDMLPEIAVGRISAETEEEFQNFFGKNYHYVDENSYTNEICYMFGEDMNWTPQTWGGDYMDEIIPLIPNDFHIFTLYDKDGTNSPQAVINAINSGLAMVHHVGHCNENYAFGITTANVDNLSNTEFGFAYTQGCLPAAFDEQTSGQNECIGEHFIFNSSGFFAFIGNTRYGWGQIGSTNGGSQAYQKSFVKGLFENNLPELGKAMNFSRYELVNEALSIQVMRWIHYELTILGDPSIRVKNPLGTFPYLKPETISYNDEEGDGDGNVNPGETVEIIAEIKNYADWSDAENVTAVISFDDENIQIVNDECNFGNIPAGSSSDNQQNPFIVSIPANTNYADYQYHLQINAPTSAGMFTKNFDFQLSVNLFQKNWPWFGDFSVNSVPVIIEENTHDKKLLVVDSKANLNLLDKNAEMESGYPILNDENLERSVAFCDLNNDEEPEIIYASRNGNISATDLDGNLLFSFSDCSMQLLTPVVSDITGDGEMNIIGFGIDRKIYCLNSIGELIAGFPVELPSISNTEIAVADLDGDAADEIIIGLANGELYAVKGNCQILSGFPVSFNSSVSASPIVLDNKNIALGTSDNKLYLVSPAGEIILQKVLQGNIASAPVAADFDGDNELEIAFSTRNGFLYLCEQTGEDFPGFPLNLSETIVNSPLIADLNGDDNLDILQFTANSNFYAIDFTGNFLDSTPVPVNLSGNTPATIADIDGDNDFEIICGTSVGVCVIDYKLRKGTKIPWSTYRGNLCRTAYYNDNILITEDNENSSETEIILKQNYPNPFTVSTTISFEFSNEQHQQNEQNTISIYNIKGQKIKTLECINQVDAKATKSFYSTTWDGTDFNNKKVASGLYIYKLTLENKTKVKKMLMIK